MIRLPGVVLITEDVEFLLGSIVLIIKNVEL